LKRLLIVIDSLTRNNGAHVATRAMIAALRKRGVVIDLLLGRRTDDVEGLEGVDQYEFQEPQRGFRWFISGIYRRLKLAPAPRWVLDSRGNAHRLMRRYDTVLVVGENSHFRYLVSGVKGSRKVVFIHTDYVNWKTSCNWAVEDSRFDRQIYRGFDVIAIVGKANAARFSDYYPEFKDKVCAFHNLFNANTSAIHPKHSTAAILKIVTMSRLEIAPQKKIDRIVRVAAELKRRGCQFDWTIYGKGTPDAEVILMKMLRENNVLDVLHLGGFTNDVQNILAGADLHILLSAYEGEPNVIIEAQMLGVPCIATDVGAVREMVDDGISGMIVPQNEKQIVDMLEQVFLHTDKICEWKKNLSGYKYDNENVLSEYHKILDL